MLWDTKNHHWEDHKHRNHTKSRRFHDTKQRKAMCFLVSNGSKLNHLRTQMVSNGAKWRKVRKTTKHWPILEALKSENRFSLTHKGHTFPLKKQAFWLSVPGANASFEKPNKIRAFRTPKSNFRNVSNPKAL